MTALSLPLNELTENDDIRLVLPPARPMSRLLIPLVRLETVSPEAPAAAPTPTPASRRQPASGNEVLAPWCKLVEDSKEPAFVLDVAGTVVSASAQAAELLGEFGADQVIGHHLLDVVDLVDF